MPAVQCDQCDHCFPVSADDAGAKVRCPKCKAKVRVPEDTPVRHAALDDIHTGFHVVKWALIVLGLLVAFGVAFHLMTRGI